MLYKGTVVYFTVLSACEAAQTANVGEPVAADKANGNHLHRPAMLNARHSGHNTEWRETAAKTDAAEEQAARERLFTRGCRATTAWGTPSSATTVSASRTSPRSRPCLAASPASGGSASPTVRGPSCSCCGPRA